MAAYIKDTTDFLNEITKIEMQPNDWLVTVDVKSLYTRQRRRHPSAWLTQKDDPQQPPPEVLRYLLELVLKLNTLELNGKFYLKTRGTVMGSRCAPTYANIFMGNIEKKILQTGNIQPLFYKRFIDDIIMITRCLQEEIESFLTQMNRANPNITFTHEKSLTSIT